MLLEELDKKDNNSNKIEILEKIKKIDENIYFYKNLKENKSKGKYSYLILYIDLGFSECKNNISIENKKTIKLSKNNECNSIKFKENINTKYLFKVYYYN